MKQKSTQVINGQPVFYKFHQGYFERCCGCGLVHLVIPAPVPGGVTMTVYRDDYQTRRGRKR